MGKNNVFMRLSMQFNKLIHITGVRSKQIIVGILIFSMIWTMLPLDYIVEASPDGATETANFYTNSSRALELLGQGASWDAANKKLTMNNVSFTTSADCGILLPEGSVIILRGKNTINVTGSTVGIGPGNNNGFYFSGSTLLFKGDGSLTVNANSVEYGIYAMWLDFTDNVTITIGNCETIHLK